MASSRCGTSARTSAAPCHGVQEFEFDGDKGWYRCPCHGSTYTKAGVRVYGPAPHGMNVMEIDIDKSGNIVVQTGKITTGSPRNPTLAVLPPA